MLKNIRPIILLCLIGLIPAPVWAENTISDSDVIIMTPQKIRIDYGVQKDDLILRLYTVPPITACGLVTELPLDMQIDADTLDIYVDDYGIIPLSAARGDDCGPSYKVADATVRIPGAAQEISSVQKLRFWYKNDITTILIDRNSEEPTLLLAGDSKIFEVGVPKANLDKASNQITAPTATQETIDTTNILLISTGDDAVDRKNRSAIKKLAQSRGLMTTDDPDLFIDQTGEYYQHLGQQSVIEVGTIMINGKSQAVYATRLQQ